MGEQETVNLQERLRNPPMRIHNQETLMDEAADRLDALEAERDAARDEHYEAQERIAALETAYDNQASLILTLQAERDALKARVEQRKEALDDITEMSNAQTERIAELEEQQGRREAQLEILNRYHDRIMDALEVGSIEDAAIKAEAAIARATELEARIIHLRENRNDLVDRVAELAKENVQLKADIADLERHE